MKYLYCINGHYYYRFKIAKDLQTFFRCNIIKKTLRTKDLKLAALSVKLLSAELLRVTGLIRSGILNDEQINQLVREFFYNFLNKSEEYKLNIEIATDDGTKENLIAFIEYQIEHLKKHVDSGPHKVEGFVDTFLEQKAISYNHNKSSDEYKKIRRAFVKTLIQFYKIEKERILGNFDNFADDFQSVLRKPSIQGMKLSELIKEYVKEKISQKKWNNKNTDELTRLLNQFLEIMTDKVITDITRNDFLRYLDILKELPKNLNKMPGVRDLPFKELITRVENKDMGDFKYNILDVTTINKKLTDISAIFRYAHNRGYIPINIASELKLNDDSKDDEERKAYETADLNKWFHSPVFTQWSSEELKQDPEKFWIPLIMAFCGCQTNEICQLYKADITKVEGIWCIDINRKKDKSLKKKNRKRLVPVHPFLVELGFLKYVDSVQHERIWSNLKRGKDGYSDDFNKWIGRYNRLHITDDPDKVPYSFRHSFITNLKHSGIDSVIVSEIVGHSVQGMTYGRYGKDFPVKAKLEVMEKLNYGINLSHLKFPVKGTKAQKAKPTAKVKSKKPKK